ncbi:predicted protein [Postia placenta Mad-698-R]|nr:predicted protein [Postia placenta Mad-698-R]
MFLGPALVEMHIEIDDDDCDSTIHGIPFLTGMCCVCTNLEVLRLNISCEDNSPDHIGAFVQMVQSIYRRLRIFCLSAKNDSSDRCDSKFMAKPIVDLLRTTCSRSQEFSLVEIPVPADGVIKLATNPHLRDVCIYLDKTTLKPSPFEGIHRPFSALRAMRFSVEHLDEHSLSFLGSVSSGVLARLIIDVENLKLDSVMLHAHIQKLQQSPFRDTLALFGLDFKYSGPRENMKYEFLKPLFDLPRISRLFLRWLSAELVRTIAEKQPHIELVDEVS